MTIAFQLAVSALIATSLVLLPPSPFIRHTRISRFKPSHL